MPRIVKPELAADLTDLFPVLEPRSLSPTSISEELILTQPLLPGTHKFRNFVISIVSGAIASISVDGPVVPVDRYWYLFAASLRDTEAIAKTSLIRIQQGAGEGPTLAVATPGIIPAGFPLVAIPRAFLLPQGLNIRGVVNTESAGQNLTLVSMYVEHRLLDPPPGL